MPRIAPIIGRQSDLDSIPTVGLYRRVFAIADIQGSVESFSYLRRHIAQLIQQQGGDEPLNNTILYLGDYVGPGKDSFGVIETLLSAPIISENVEEVYLLGDRDHNLLNFIHGRALSMEWLHHQGGKEILESYGLDLSKNNSGFDLTEMRQALLTKMPPDHLHFLERLNLTHEVGDYFFSHAGVNPRYNLQRQSPCDLINGQDKFLTSRRKFDKIVVHGHDAKLMPVERFNRIGVNTDVAKTGVLTCLVLENEKKRFIQTSSPTESPGGGT